MIEAPETSTRILTSQETLSATEIVRARTAKRKTETVRVCHVSMTLLTGGLERLLVEFARRHRADTEPRFVALDALGPPAEDIRDSGHFADSLEFSNSGRLSTVRTLARLLRDEGINVVHTHNTYAHFFGSAAAKLAGIAAVINTQHGRGCGDHWKDRLLFRVANRFASKIVGVSEDATRLCRRQDSKSAAKMCCIWNGIDVARFAFAGPVDQPVAVSVARLSPEKDFPTLLQAVALVLRSVPDFRLRIVGEGGERPRLEQLIRELRIENHVTLVGASDDVPAELRRAGFYVASSRKEGVSLTLLEAMAVGLPIVTTNVGGNPEVVEDGVTGRLVPPGNPRELARAIVQMCDEQENWLAMGRAGRRRVEQHFDIIRMIDAYETLYREILNT
jgi:glycosyltransferase involved in cell wall biosynthesis